MTREPVVDEMGALALLKLVFWGSTIIAALTVDSASSAKVTVSAKSLYTQVSCSLVLIRSSI